MVVAEGTPEEVAAVPESHTGTFLAPILEGRGAQQPGAPRRQKVVAAKSAPASRTTKRAPAKKTAKTTAATTAKKAPARKAAAKKSS
jgi:excinuclease ABC subunit A